MAPRSITVPDPVVDALAERVARTVVLRLAEHLAGRVGDGYLAPDAAADYLGVSRKRIYDLKSARTLEPDGYDGRTPLFTRATLDAYVRGDSR